MRLHIEAKNAIGTLSSFVRMFRDKRVVWFVALGFLPWNMARGAELFHSRIFSSTQAIAALTAGDFDPRHPGNELACLMADGSVVELALGESGWMANTIFQYKGTSVGPWEPTMRATLNVGDVLPEHPGREIVLSFQQQVVTVYYTASHGWTNQLVRDVAGLVATTWGAEVGDCDYAHANEEIFSIVEWVFDFSAGTVYSAANGMWQSNDVYNSEVGMDAAIGDSNPDLAGNEIILVTEMGPAYEIMPPTAGGFGLWPKRRIWNDPENAGWVVKIADAGSQSPGNEIVYGTRYSDRIMMSRHNGTNAHQVNVLLTGVNTNHPNSMLDVAIGQAFPASPSAEILGVDMSGALYVVQQVTNGWQGSILWQDTNALHAVAVVDLIPTAGDEVVVAGASGNVTLLYNAASALTMAWTAQQQAILSWHGIAGLTYTVETATNLVTSSPWRPVTNLTVQGGFSRTLSYTNAEANETPGRFFRVRASR